MLGTSVGLAVTLGALALFAVVGAVAAGRFGADERDRYLTARGTQRGGSLALNFFASALGAWILFAPPEVGTFAGLFGIIGYAVGQAAAIGVYAWLGPRIRARLPGGSTILEFVRRRYGRAAHAGIGGVSVFYMAIFLTAELTAIGGVLGLLTGIDPWVPIAATAAITAAYVAYGGLPASLATDRLQGWLILALVAISVVAIVGEVPDAGRAMQDGGLWSLHDPGTFVWLTIAIVAANLFHQGFWQRSWAARDDGALRRGALLGAALIVPVILALGALGALAAGAGRADPPSLAFFHLLAGLPAPVLALVVALGVALVASTVDTLQNALASLVAVDVAGGRLPLGAARWVTVALTVPAALVAVRGYSVLRLFLIADLLAAAVALPVFLGLWHRVTTAGAVAGAVAGLLGVVAVGWVDGGTVADGLRWLTLPPEASPLGPFLAAPIASGVVTLGASLAAGRSRRAAREDPPTSSSR